MNWKICLGVILTFTIIAIPLGIMFIIFGLLDMRKKSKIINSGWGHKTFINSVDILKV